MNRKRNALRLVGGMLAASLGLAVPGDARGQAFTWVTTGETGGDDVTLLFTQLTVAPDRPGFRPFGRLSLYRLATEFDDNFTVAPAVGLEYASEFGLLAADIGYSFRDE